MKAATAREGKAKGSKDERTGQEKRERTGHTHTHTHTHTQHARKKPMEKAR